MKIIEIQWNGRVQDVTHIGTKTGTYFAFNKAKVETYGRDRVIKIEEETLTIYNIYYANGKILRVFNPIQVLMEKLKS